MNTIWTYGCSFTQGMWEFDYKKSNEKLIYPASDFSKRRPYIQGSKKNWPTILSNSMGYDVINRGVERSGPLHAMELCMIDALNWNINDIIIFEISYINRGWDIYKSEMSQYNNKQFEEKHHIWLNGFFELLNNYTKVKWYWWSVENLESFNSKYSQTLLKFGEFESYQEWITSDKSLFYDSYVGNHCVDYHQNMKAHYLQAEFFKNQLMNNLEL